VVASDVKGAIQKMRDTFWPILDTPHPPCVIWCHGQVPMPPRYVGTFVIKKTSFSLGYNQLKKGNYCSKMSVTLWLHLPYPMCQFCQHFMRIFCTNIFAPKNYKAKT